MDTTEKNIKMLEKATEIQLLKPPWGENWTKEFFTYNSGGDLIWLPRQDQLQDMLELIPDVWTGTVQLLYEFARSIVNTEYEYKITSMEQLWLAFVMKEKWQKVWDDQKEDWVELTKAPWRIEWS